jgi:2'-5' RNA ligase
VSEPRSVGSDRARLFFALWPDPVVRHWLAQEGSRMQGELGGKPTREDSVHMTLVFLGDVGVERIPALERLAAQAPFDSFDLRMARAGCFARNGVAWVGPDEIPAPLGRLVAHLERGLEEEGFRLEQRAFAPHVTVLRKTQCKAFEQPLEPIDWEVSDFALMRSELHPDGSRYRVLGCWPEPTR